MENDGEKSVSPDDDTEPDRILIVCGWAAARDLRFSLLIAASSAGGSSAGDGEGRSAAPVAGVIGVRSCHPKEDTVDGFEVCEKVDGELERKESGVRGENWEEVFGEFIPSDLRSGMP